MNTLPARVAAAGPEGATVDVAGGTQPVGAHAGEAGRSLVIGMRPEDLRIASPEATGIPATVRVVESLGHEVLVLCRVEGVDGDVVVDRKSTRLNSGH